MHHALIVAELRAMPPRGGWTEYEATGRACVICPCGLNSGFTDKTDAARQYRDHARANPPARSVRVHPETGESSAVLVDMLDEITKD